MARFVQVTSISLEDPVISDPFVMAIHRQVVANGGTSFSIDTEQQRTYCVNNMQKLMDNGFWEAWRLETEKSPVSALLLVKEGYSIDDRVVVRFEDVVADYQHTLSRSRYGKMALLAGGAMALERYGSNIAITGEADEEKLKPGKGTIYQEVGGIQTGRQAARFNHDALVKFRDSEINWAYTLYTQLNIFSASGNIAVELNSRTSAETKEQLARIAADLPVAYRAVLTFGNNETAQAAKEDRASIIRSATFDFSKPPTAGENESPIGSQIDSFSCSSNFYGAVPESFRVLAELMTAPQKSRTGGDLVLQQSFCDVAVDLQHPKQMEIVNYYGLSYNNYATKEELAKAGNGVSQIYWTDRPQLPGGFVKPQIVYALK